MKINSVSKNKPIKPPNFKKGLTKSFVEKANNISYDNAKKILKQKGIKSVKLRGQQTVAISCIAVTEIFKSFGLILPEKLSYENFLQEYIDGNYTYPEDKVRINASFNHFKNLSHQDDFETYRRGSPITKHFLATYIHEFIHAAHFKHLATKYSSNEVISIAEKLQQYTPVEFLLNPKVIKPTWESWEVNDWNGSILGSYAGKDLMEFFTENASFEISRILEKNPLGNNKGENLFFNPKNPKRLSLSFLDIKIDNFWNRIFSKKDNDRDDFLKAIWNGNLDVIFSEKYSKFIRKKESI